MERALGGRSGLRVRPDAAAGRGLLDRHPAAHRLRVAARRARLLLHPHGHRRPLPPDDRTVGLLPDRLGRQRAADRAAGAERLRGAGRCLAAVRPVGFFPAGEAGQDRAAGVAAELHRAVRAAHRPRRAGLRGDVAADRALGGLVAALHDDQRLVRGGSRSGRSCATWPAARRTGRRRRRCGTSASRPRSPRPSSRTARWPARSTGSRSTAFRRRAGPVWIETTRPELLPACVALVAHPDDERYQLSVRVVGAHAGVRRAGAGARAPAGRAGQGVGDRDGVHLRRPDRRDLVAGARPAAAVDHRAQRAAAARAAGRRARRAVRGAGGQDRVLGPGADGRAAADERRPGRARRGR